jgi:hypothetical protein
VLGDGIIIPDSVCVSPGKSILVGLGVSTAGFGVFTRRGDLVPLVIGPSLHGVLGVIPVAIPGLLAPPSFHGVIG